ncbi:MAG: hypothetical protein SFY32_15350 [Bacteroidota bacterium]|nr:hypothetical protein [Bacteroidota bacterium]
MRITICIIILSGLIITVCAQTKVSYDFPKAMSESTKKAFFEQSEKGRILYEMSCAGCHNFKVKRNEYIPDFTPNQLSGYVLRVLNTEHEMGIPEEKITSEDMGLIMTFLTYKTKHGLRPEKGQDSKKAN